MPQPSTPSAAPSSQILRSLEKAELLEEGREGIDWFMDLDHGLEYCENELLASMPIRCLKSTSGPIPFLKPSRLRNKPQENGFSST